MTTTTTRRSGIHTFLNSRNNLCLLTCRSPSPTERRRPHPAPRSRPASWAKPATELKFYVRRLLHLTARPEVGWRVHGRAHPSTSTHACAVTGTTVFDTHTAALQPHPNRQRHAQRPTVRNLHRLAIQQLVSLSRRRLHPHGAVAEPLDLHGLLRGDPFCRWANQGGPYAETTEVGLEC